MTFRRITRSGAVLALAGSGMVAALSLAGPVFAVQASAAVRLSPGVEATGCTTDHVQGIFYNGTTTPPMIVADNQDVYDCSGEIIRVDLPASISKLESGTWVNVANGSGYAYYYCNGTADNQYEDQADQVITATCV